MKTRNLSVTSSDICNNCHGINVKVINRSDTVDYRGFQLDVEDLQYTQCNSCHRQFESNNQAHHNSGQIRAEYSRIRDLLRKQDGMLSGEEIAEIRNCFGLSQRDAAVIFGGGYNAFNKYESGEVLQSIAMDRLLRLTKSIGTPALKILETVTISCRPGFQLARQNTTLKSASLSIFVFLVNTEHSNTDIAIQVTSKENQESILKTLKSSVYLNQSIGGFYTAPLPVASNAQQSEISPTLDSHKTSQTTFLREITHVN